MQRVIPLMVALLPILTAGGCGDDSETHPDGGGDTDTDTDTDGDSDTDTDTDADGDTDTDADADTDTDSDADADTDADGDGDVPVEWEKLEIALSLDEQGPVEIGDGRGDGVTRVYTGDSGFGMGEGRLHEHTYTGAEWERLQLGEDTGGIRALGIGAIGVHDAPRLYAAAGGLFEFAFEADAGHWVQERLFEETLSSVDALVVGDGRNDDQQRLYGVSWDSIIEASFVGAWSDLTVETGGADVNELVLADGRNDGTNRLYAVERYYDGSIVELSWKAGAWSVEGTIPLDRSVAGIVAGDGRNDGVVRLYICGEFGIDELTWSGDQWVGEPLATQPAVAIGIGRGRNDGRTRVYSAQTYLIEYSFNNGWSTTSGKRLDTTAVDLACGDGRDDGVERIYITAQDSRVYELTARPRTPIL